MIILDTNVLSAFMRPDPDLKVADWLDRQPSASVWTTAVTIFEIEFGLQRMPQGKRREFRERKFQELVSQVLDGRVLSFDTKAAIAAGALSAALQAQGRTVEIRDVQIAGIARSRNAAVATGNVKHFELACEVHNPWGSEE